MPNLFSGKITASRTLWPRTKLHQLHRSLRQPSQTEKLSELTGGNAKCARLKYSLLTSKVSSQPPWVAQWIFARLEDLEGVRLRAWRTWAQEEAEAEMVQADPESNEEMEEGRQ